MKELQNITVEDRAAQNGDTATIDFEGFVDGEAFEGGKGTDYPLTLGSNTSSRDSRSSLSVLRPVIT